MSESPPRAELELEIEIAELDREIAALDEPYDYDPHEGDRRGELIDYRADLRARLQMLRHRRHIASNHQET